MKYEQTEASIGMIPQNPLDLLRRIVRVVLFRGSGCRLPCGVDQLDAVADIATKTRDDLKKETPKLSTSISTRMSVEIAGLLYDGFTLAEACEVCVYPFFPAEGGLESERVFVKQMVQGYIDDGSSNALFGANDINSAPAQ